MNLDQARRILESLPDTARVVDVGGGGSPFPRADHVIDLAPYAERNALGKLDIACAERYTAETWTTLDLCDRTPWPFEDGFFDFAVCSHVLEDIRDPIRVCSEMSRVAKAGYIEVPSRILEQSRGVEHPCYAGYYHHRWLISEEDDGLVFRLKPHSLHSLRAAIVADIDIGRRINPRHALLMHEWTGTIGAREVAVFDEAGVNEEMCRFAAAARRLPDLLVPTGLSVGAKIRKAVYFQRLRWFGG